MSSCSYLFSGVFKWCLQLSGGQLQRGESKHVCILRSRSHARYQIKNSVETAYRELTKR